MLISATKHADTSLLDGRIHRRQLLDDVIDVFADQMRVSSLSQQSGVLHDGLSNHAHRVQIHPDSPLVTSLRKGDVRSQLGSVGVHCPDESNQVLAEPFFKPPRHMDEVTFNVFGELQPEAFDR